MKHLKEMKEETAYQLSTKMNADYRTVRAILEQLEQDNLVEIVGYSSKSHNAKIYAINEFVSSKIESIIQARKSKSESVQVSSVARELQQLKDLQMKVNESEATIKSLNDLITSKDKEIWQLTNDKTVAESDLRVAQAEMKLIEDKKNSLESAWSEARLRAEALEQTVSQKDIELSKKNKQVWILGASLFVALTVALFVVALHFIK